jgi:hypothetical protein
MIEKAVANSSQRIPGRSVIMIENIQTYSRKYLIVFKCGSKLWMDTQAAFRRCESGWNGIIKTIKRIEKSFDSFKASVSTQGTNNTQ